jgi:aspartate aminotransferase
MTAGAAGGLNVVFKAILNPSDEVLVSSPYFVEYGSYISNHGGTLVEVNTLPDFSLDIAAIERALSPLTAAVLINSPHNPTGRVYPADTLAELADVLSRHGRRCGRFPYLVSDEPYRELVYDGVCVPPVLACYPESIIVSSYSKSLSLPGERIGYIAIHPESAGHNELVAALAYTTRTLGFVNAPALMQRAVALLGDARVDVAIYARRRAAFTALLDAAALRYARPEGAFYLFCQVPPGIGGEDDEAFVETLKRRLVLGVPGSGFGKRGWVRFAYCVDEAKIHSSQTAFQAALADWRGQKP